MINRYLIPELRNEIPFGHRGMFQEDVDIALHALDRFLPLINDKALFDTEYDKRVQTAWTNWELTLNF